MSDLDRHNKMDLHAEACWQHLVQRYGPPIEPAQLDMANLQLAIAQRRALRVICMRDGYGSGAIALRLAQREDALQGIDWQLKYPYFCIAFPQPCELTDAEITALANDVYWWETWADVCESTAVALRQSI